MTPRRRLSLMDPYSNEGGEVGRLRIILAFAERVGLPGVIAAIVLWRIDTRLDALVQAVNALASHLMTLRPP